MLRIRGSFHGQDEAVGMLRDALDDEVRNAVVVIADDIGESAQANHQWQNRTGDLQAETHGSNVVEGNLWDDSLQGEVVGDTDYGSFLEENQSWSWLEPAAQARDGHASGVLDHAIAHAAQRAGWH